MRKENYQYRPSALPVPVLVSQHFASGFLQIPPHDGHPCLPLTVLPVGPGRGIAIFRDRFTSR